MLDRKRSLHAAAFNKFSPTSAGGTNRIGRGLIEKLDRIRVIAKRIARSPEADRTRGSSSPSGPSGAQSQGFRSPGLPDTLKPDPQRLRHFC